jgi:hypothetical protein
MYRIVSPWFHNEDGTRQLYTQIAAHDPRLVAIEIENSFHKLKYTWMFLTRAQTLRLIAMLFLFVIGGERAERLIRRLRNFEAERRRWRRSTTNARDNC